MLIVGGFAFSELLSRIIASNELTPLPPGDPKNLLSIDRSTVTQTIDPNANGLSNLGLYAAYGYALLDPILSGVRDGRRAFLVDVILYAESIALTQAFTDATKIGVRRPRPVDYANCYPPMTPPAAGCDSTDLQLSFFSGHTSVTAAISATATYLAFVRAPHSKRPWITLAAGTLLTGFVAYERVRSGNHFPTDVLMASMAGGGIGVLVPHLHRRAHYHENELEAPQVWIGFAPETRGGGQLTLGGKF